MGIEEIRQIIIESAEEIILEYQYIVYNFRLDRRKVYKVDLDKYCMLVNSYLES